MYIYVLSKNLYTSTVKKIPHFLWLNCFYSEIKYLRQNLNKNNLKDFIIKVSEIKQFFFDLLKQLLDILKIKFDGISFVDLLGPINEDQFILESKRIYIPALYTANLFLIYISDLERYIQSSNKENTNWNIPIRYYSHALELNPSEGRTHNQLACLYSISGEYLSSFYHYLRAFYAKFCFIDARKNFIEFIRVSYKRMNTKFKNSRSNSLVVYCSTVKNKDDFQNILIYFLSSLFGENHFEDLSKFVEFKRVILSALKRIFLSKLSINNINKLDEAHLFLQKVLVISICALTDSFKNQDKLSISDKHLVFRKTFSASWSYSFLTLILENLSSLAKTKILSNVLLFCDYLIHNDESMKTICEITLLNDYTKEATQSRSSFFASLAETVNMLDKLVKNNKTDLNDIREDHINLLPEYQNLNGLKPFKEVFKSSPLLKDFWRDRTSFVAYKKWERAFEKEKIRMDNENEHFCFVSFKKCKALEKKKIRMDNEKQFLIRYKRIKRFISFAARENFVKFDNEKLRYFSPNSLQYEVNVEDQNIISSDSDLVLSLSDNTDTDYEINSSSKEES